MLVHLREQVRQLLDQNKDLLDRLMAMVPPAAEQYTRMSLASNLAQRHGVADGMAPLSSAFDLRDPEDRMLDDYVEQFQPSVDGRRKGT